jgi:hypothetical protein
MPPIRPLQRDDIPQVASLYEVVSRSGSTSAPPGLAAYFERFFLDHPWFDPEIPSLVYTDKDGRVVGFLGSHVRRFSFDGRTIRAGCSGQLVTEPDARNQAAGAFLMQAYMDGPQDLTFTDTASDYVRRIWERLGGETFQLGCVGWVRVFRPWRFAASYRARHDPAGELGALTGSLSSAFDTVSVRLPRVPFRSRAPETTAEELTAGVLAERLSATVGPTRLHPDYDEAFAAWLLRELAAVHVHGRLVARLVRDSAGEIIGWFVYYLREGGISQVMQVAAHERRVGAVLDQLFHEAEEGGAAALQGRLEPRLMASLSTRRCLLHFSGYLALVHARDHEILAAIASGRSLFTRMEGEWWMGHHLLPFGDA